MFGRERVSLVHLDTNFLSQFAKAEMGQLGVSPDAKKWGELLARLRREVQLGTLICPALEFPLQEALLSPNLVPQFTRIRTELSKGYFFKYWENILVHQTANQVLKYLGRAQDIDLSWKAFTREALGVVPPWDTRTAKEKAKQFAEELQKQGAPQRSYAEQYEAERISLLQESFLQPLRRLQGLDTYLKSPDPKLGMLIREANISKNELPKVLEFFESDLVDRIPYIHIYCSIRASLSIHEPARKPKRGDFLDIPALACAIPYCDIITTDKSMKTQVVNRLHLDEKYPTRIFSASAKDLDAFLDALASITR